jgi:hypothetical protein
MIRRSYSTTAFLFYIFENIEEEKKEGERRRKRECREWSAF